MVVDIAEMIKGDIPTMLEVFDLVKRVEKIELSPTNNEKLVFQIEDIKKDIELIKKNISTLFKNDEILQNRIIQLEKNTQNIPVYSTEIVISQIEKIECLETFEYQGSEFNSYLIKLYDNNSYFYLNSHICTKPPNIDDFISHKFDGDRIKEWKRINKEKSNRKRIRELLDRKYNE
jgi:hypothetical protein